MVDGWAWPVLESRSTSIKRWASLGHKQPHNRLTNFAFAPYVTEHRKK